MFQPQLSVMELSSLERMLRDSLYWYWYERDDFFALLDKLGCYKVDAVPALREVQKKMNHPHEREKNA